MQLQEDSNNRINRHSQAEKVFESARQLTSVIIKWLKIRDVVLRFDSSVIVRYGNQQGAKKGYNPTKKGRFSHNPLIAFIDNGLIVNLWNSPDNSSSIGGIVDFFDNTIIFLNVNVYRIAADTGYYLVSFIEHLEMKAFKYIIGAPMCQVMQKEILNIKL